MSVPLTTAIEFFRIQVQSECLCVSYLQISHTQLMLPIYRNFLSAKVEVTEVKMDESEDRKLEFKQFVFKSYFIME